MLKELIFTGLGASVLLRKRIEEEVSILQKSGKLKKKDAKTFLENLEAKGKLEDKRIKKHFKKIVREAIDELGLVTKKDLKNFKEEMKNQEMKNQEMKKQEIKNEEIK